MLKATDCPLFPFFTSSSLSFLSWFVLIRSLLYMLKQQEILIRILCLAHSLSLSLSFPLTLLSSLRLALPHSLIPAEIRKPLTQHWMCISIWMRAFRGRERRGRGREEKADRQSKRGRVVRGCMKSTKRQRETDSQMMLRDVHLFFFPQKTKTSFFLACSLLYFLTLFILLQVTQLKF